MKDEKFWRCGRNDKKVKNQDMKGAASGKKREEIENLKKSVGEGDLVRAKGKRKEVEKE